MAKIHATRSANEIILRMNRPINRKEKTPYKNNIHICEDMDIISKVCLSVKSCFGFASGQGRAGTFEVRIAFLVSAKPIRNAAYEYTPLSFNRETEYHKRFCSARQFCG